MTSHKLPKCRYCGENIPPSFEDPIIARYHSRWEDGEETFCSQECKESWEEEVE